jgi:hypothetical protein
MGLSIEKSHLVKRRITQHKRFVPYGTRPNFCFAKISFMLESLAEILLGGTPNGERIINFIIMPTLC